ncbi:MAG: hypothetical protein JO372_23225 [Solirubrobacterales bacterium]|nr:hypothetical protein [Solirubrobacterales bacterium]
MPESGPVTCAGCGVLCDDVTIERAGEDVVLQPPCDLGAQWFSERARAPESTPAATVDGQAADVEAALTRAAELLRGARRPLLHGFQGATVEDVRAAVALADRLGAVIATDWVAGAWPGVAAAPLRGTSTATLGEIRDRSQVVLIWREDPERTHPRLLERLGFGSSSAGVGAERTLAVVDDRDTATAQRADLRLRWSHQRDLDALISLHALQRGMALAASDLESELGGLLERLQAVPHAAFIYGTSLGSGAGGQRRALALHELVRALSAERHVVTLALPSAPGIRAAQDVLAWQTGYSGNVDLASGHPELLTATRPLEDSDEVDVSLLIEGNPDDLPADATRIALCSLPVPGAQVSIRTAPAGVAATGTGHRMDGVPLALQAPLPGDASTAATLLGRLLVEVEG